MAQTTIEITMRVNKGRLHSMMQQATAEIRRARRRDRAALFHRWSMAMIETCVAPLLDGKPAQVWQRSPAAHKPI